MELKGKHAVITGAAKGIGKAIALRLAEAGCEILAADVDDAEGKKTIQEINAVSRGYYVHADISKEEDVCNLKHEADLLWDDVNILINNAAIQTEDPLFDTTIADFRRVVDTNLVGTFMMCSVFARDMNEHDTILNMLSVHYEKPRLNKFGYDASKAGIAIMTEELALALADRHVTVNGIRYGAVRTAMNADWTDEESAAVREKIPLEWIAEPEEIAEYTKVILETFSEHATGSVFTIDGGRRLK